MLASLLHALRNLFKKPATIAYPAAPLDAAPGYRGLVRYNQERCIFCYKCERLCPAGAILFVGVERTEQPPVRHYNPYLCIYCGECVRNCPKSGPEGALFQSEELPPPATAADRVNQAWFVVEKESDKSRQPPAG